MAKSNKPNHISKPTYTGGAKAISAFIKEHLRYPEAARAARVEGTVVVRYSLDYRGKVVGAKVKKGIGSGCDEEAERVVKLLRFNVPQNRKRKVRIHQNINIHFKLPKEKKKKLTMGGKVTGTSGGMKITYTTVPATAKATEDKGNKAPKSGGGYSISWQAAID